MRNDLRGPLPALLGCAACAAALVALMLVAYYDAGAQRLDATALYGFTTLESGVLKVPAWGFALIGGVFPLALGLVALYYFAGRWDRRREAVAAIVVMLAANVTTQILKVVFSHPRIQPILDPHQVNAASFPSGHATSAMSMAVAALLVVPPRWRTLTAVGGGALVFGVSFSVLVLRWHFPSDVLGGILVATGYGFAALAALRHLDRRALGRRTATEPGSPLRPRLEGAAVLEGAAATVVLAGVVLAFAYAHEILDYAGTYTTSVLTALVISSMAAALLALFSFTASD
jgi:membrane-associated phospholipid phosphatase